MSEVKTTIHVDESDNVFHWVRVQDCEPIIEANKRMQNEKQTSDTWRLVARIPDVVIELWLIEEEKRGHFVKYLSKEFDELLERKLADPDWKWLRTST